MTYRLNITDPVPFFTSIDHEGAVLTSTDLLGSFYVLYFYPKDDTPGCTLEACSFRDHMNRLKDLGVTVLGVSPDGKDSHQQFIKKYHLNYSLLSDEKKELCQQFDVLRDNEKLERTTFIINDSGKIIWVERPVKVDGHVDRIIQSLQEMKNS